MYTHRPASQGEAPSPRLHVADVIRTFSCNGALLFKILFDTASATLLELGRNPKWLGAQLGVTAVLHTWTREMLLHSHLHCIVTGGGLSADTDRWVELRDP